MFPFHLTHTPSRTCPTRQHRPRLKTALRGIACFGGLLCLAATASARAEAASAAPASYAPGYLSTDIAVPHRPAAVPLSVWYPANSDGELTYIGRNPLFPGEQVHRHATPAAGEHPLVVLSHGAGGLPEGLVWLGAALAKHGYVVAAPKHPGSSFGDYDFDRVLNLADRRRDLVATLDTVLAGELPIGTVRHSEITALGFSMGGHSVLSLAGARASLDRYRDYCDGAPYMDCTWWRQNQLDLASLSRSQFESGERDVRLTRLIAVDPGLAAAYEAQSLEAIELPTQLINLGNADVIFAGIDAAPLAARIPQASHHRVPNATHFSFLGLCVENAEAILREEGEAEPICSDGKGGDRRQIHATLLSTMLAFMGAEAGAGADAGGDAASD